MLLVPCGGLPVAVQIQSMSPPVTVQPVIGPADAVEGSGSRLVGPVSKLPLSNTVAAITEPGEATRASHGPGDAQN